MPEFYKIRIDGLLQDRWEEWFEGMKISWNEDGTSTLSGSLSDQAALHGVLLKIGNMNLKLLSVRRVEATISDNEYKSNYK